MHTHTHTSKEKYEVDRFLFSISDKNTLSKVTDYLHTNHHATYAYVHNKFQKADGIGT
jgi:hypothetical protein